MKAPTAPPDGRGTSPKYDDENYVCGFSLHLVVFGGGRRGLARVDGMRSRQAESERQVNELSPRGDAPRFESMLV